MQPKNSDLDPQKIYQRLLNELRSRNIKHEGHEFLSGVFLLDIWHNGSFYVLQIGREFLGFSKPEPDDLGLDMIPDIKFFSIDQLMVKLNLIFDDR